MPRYCTNCGLEARTTAKFCRSCGTALVAGGNPSPVSRPGQPATPPPLQPLTPISSNSLTSLPSIKPAPTQASPVKVTPPGGARVVAPLSTPVAQKLTPLSAPAPSPPPRQNAPPSPPPPTPSLSLPTAAAAAEPATVESGPLRLRCRACQKVCQQSEKFCYACGAPLAVMGLGDLLEISVTPNESRDLKVYLGNQGGGSLRARARLVGADNEPVSWARLQTTELALDQDNPGGTFNLLLNGTALARTDARRCSLVISSNTRHEPRGAIPSGSKVPPRLWDVWCRKETILPLVVKLSTPPRLRLNTDSLTLDVWSPQDCDLHRHLQMCNGGEGTLDLLLQTDQPSLLEISQPRASLQAGRWEAVPAKIQFAALKTDVALSARLIFRDGNTSKELGSITVRFRRREARELGVVFGVDFGTSTSKVATVLSGSIEVVRFPCGDTFPSVLFVDHAIVKRIGPDALQDVGKEGYIKGIKRLLVESDERAQELEIANRNGGVEKLIGAFLQRLLGQVYESDGVRKRWGDSLSSENVTLIATVPARARGQREDSMRRILTEIGLQQVRVLVESTAAAYLYALQEEYLADGAFVMVFDCGAGTTDISLLRFQLRRNEEDGIFERLFEPVVEIGIERGGQDLDHAFYDLVARRLNQEERSALTQRAAEEGRERWSRLVEELERIKLTLCGNGESTGASEAILRVPGLVKEMSLSVKDFEQATRALVDEMLEGVWRALLQASEATGKDVDPLKIEKVYMVGGTTLVPRVRESLEQIFTRRKVLGYPDRLTAVARGAVASLFPIKRVVSANYGYRRGKAEPFWFLKKGTTCPLAERELPLAPASSPLLEIVETRNGEGVRKIGEIDLSAVPPGTDPPLRYGVDDQGLLHCTVSFDQGGQTTQLRMMQSGDS